MANRYVRSTGGNWNTAGTWESASGAKDAVAVPAATDDVFCDGQSGQVTVDGTTCVAKTVNCADIGTGAYASTMTFTAAQILTVSGSVTFVSGMVIAGTGTLTINASGTITSAGKRLTGALTFSATNTCTLADALTIDGTLTLTAATTFSGAFNITCNALTCNGAVTHTISGNINVANALTITTGAVVINGAFNINVYGNLTLTAQPISGTATIILCGTGTWAGSSTAAIVSNNLTINTIGTITIGTCYYSTGILTHTAGTLAGTGTLFLRGSCTINSSRGRFYSVTFSIAGTYDVQSLWAVGTISVLDNCTWTNFIILGNPIISLTNGKTQTISGTFSVRLSDIWGTADHATISCANAIVVFFSSIKNINFTGGGTFTVYGGTNVSGNSGVTFTALPYTKPITYYLDYENGIDSTVTPWGFWSVDYTGGSGTAPAVDETMTGATSSSTAKVTFVEVASGAWGSNNAIGTIWFYAKSAAFVAEQLDCAVSGHCHIAADLVYCAWKTISGGALASRIAPGDTIRIAKSPIPTSLAVNGTWTNCPVTLPTAKNIVSSTNAGPINVQVTGHGYATGDIIYIQNHTINLTANGTWTITWVNANNFTLDGSTGIGVGGATGSCTKIEWHCVKLASALTQTITRCEQAWTAANGSTVTLDTSIYKEGDGSAKIIKTPTPLNSTLYAYFAITEINLSSYQKVSFWIMNSAVMLANQWNLCLCSDTAGATIVDTIAIPAIPSTSQFMPLTIAGNNENLGSSIKSVALYSGISTGNATGIYLDNIVACTTSGLNLQSLISKNATVQGSASATNYANEGWYGIQSISEDGKIIRLDNDNDTYANVSLITRGGGYSTSGTSPHTLTLYKRETIKTSLATAAVTYVQQLLESGSAGSLIAYEGGYDTATNTQNGETFFDGLNGNGYGLISTIIDYNSINYLNFSRYGIGVFFSGSDYMTINTLTNANNNTTYGFELNTASYCTINTLVNINNTGSHGIEIQTNSKNNTITTLVNCNNNGGDGIQMYTGNNNNTFTTISNLNNNTSYGLYYYNTDYNNIITTLSNVNYNGAAGVYFLQSLNNTIVTLSNANYNNTYGVYFYQSQDNFIGSLLVTGSGTAAVALAAYGTNYLRNAYLIGTEFAGAIAGTDYRIYSEKHDQTANNHYIYTDGGNITSADGATYGHTPSGICWKLSPTDTTRTSYYPLKLSIAKVACVADKLVTVKAWFKVTNITDIYGKLACRTGQLAGVAPTPIITSNSNTNYEELTLTFTPTEAGVVEVEAAAYWALNAADESVYVDDMTITQVD